MADYVLDNDTHSLTVSLAEYEVKAMEFFVEDALLDIKKRVSEKIKTYVDIAVTEELSNKIDDPDTASMPASKEQLIMSSTRQSLVDSLSTVPLPSD